jgi:iron complex transport system substrate-binding protein
MSNPRRTWRFTIYRKALIVVACLYSAGTLGARLVTDQTGRRVNVPDAPSRLVSLAPSITETLYALGLGERLVGVTDYCDFPPEAKHKARVGSVLNPSLEAILTLRPDLVLGSPDANRIETAERIERLGIPVYGVRGRSLEETLASIEDLGRLLGRAEESLILVEHLRTRIEAVERRVVGRPKPKVLFVVWYRPLTTAGGKTFISDIIRRAGGNSITDGLAAEWPRMSLEEAVSLDPDIIIFPRTEAFSPSLGEFDRMSGWREMRAVRNRRMYFVSDSIIRPSPRLVDALEEVAGILHPAADGRGEEAR